MPQETSTATPTLVRRGLLAAGGAFPLAALLGSGRAEAAPAATLATFPSVTLADLRATVTGAVDGDICFLSDPGQEGFFRHTASDTSTPDNLGTTIVSANGLRFSRIYTGAVNVRWFGAKGDGVTDDTIALQAAIDAAQQEAASLHVPTARPYLVSSPLVIDSAKGGLRIFGDTMRSIGTLRYSTIKVADSVAQATPIASVITFTDGTEATRYEFSHLCIDGSLRAEHGIHASSLTHTLFHRIWINQTTVAAVAIGYGWNNDLLECELSINDGDGLRTIGPSVNELNLVNTKIFHNGGIGVNLAQPALSTRLDGCTVEGNRGTGIYAQQALTSLTVSNCYIEDNAADGLELSGRLVRADIILNGNSSATPALGISAAAPNGSVTIRDNIVASFRTDSFVHAHAVDRAVALTGNAINRYSDLRPGDLTAYTTLKVGTSATGTGSSVRRIRLRDNVAQCLGATVPLRDIEVMDLAGHTALHETLVDGVHPVNYCPPLDEFILIDSAATSGALTAWPYGYRNGEVRIIEGSTSSGRWGVRLDASLFPELAGRFVYFALFVRQSAAGVGTSLRCTGAGIDTQPSVSTDWRVVSQVCAFPTSGTVDFAVGMTADAAGKSLAIAKPIIAELGAPYDRFA